MDNWWKMGCVVALILVGGGVVLYLSLNPTITVRPENRGNKEEPLRFTTGEVLQARKACKIEFIEMDLGESTKISYDPKQPETRAHKGKKGNQVKVLFHNNATITLPYITVTIKRWVKLPLEEKEREEAKREGAPLIGPEQLHDIGM